MKDDGYSTRTRQTLDLMALEFGEAFERARDATVMVDAPQGRKAKPKVPKPKHTPAELLAMLGINVDDVDETAQAAVTEDMWDALELED